MDNYYIRSLIKDATQFLNHLLVLPTLPDNTLLVTMDIKSSYVNIPHKDGIEAIKQIMNKHNTDPKLTYWVSRCIKCILKNNNFTFNESNYIQTQETAMGTKMAPKYANIFMHQLKINLCPNLQKNLAIFTLYRRYLDGLDAPRRYLTRIY